MYQYMISCTNHVPFKKACSAHVQSSEYMISCSSTWLDVPVHDFMYKSCTISEGMFLTCTIIRIHDFMFQYMTRCTGTWIDVQIMYRVRKACSLSITLGHKQSSWMYWQYPYRRHDIKWFVMESWNNAVVVQPAITFPSQNESSLPLSDCELT
jgi:hypothetical protein